MIDNQESLARATKQLMLSEPFYGLFSMMLNKEWSKRVPTAGVGKNGINYMLYVNPVFWESLNELHQKMIIKHECLHICMFHVERWGEFSNKRVANIAADISINQYIDNSWLPCYDIPVKDYRKKYEEEVTKLCKLVEDGTMPREDALKVLRQIPPRGVYLIDFPELKLEPLQGIKYYYDKLMEAKDKQVGAGGCENLNKLLEGDGDFQLMPHDHDWDDFDDITDAEKSLLRSQLDYQLKEIADHVAKSRGTVPGELKGYIDGIGKKDPPKFDWKSYIRRFAGGSERVYTKKLHRKYNKRFKDNPGLKIKPKTHVLLSVDTSGSVSNSELKEFFHEIYHVQKMGAEITVLQFDAAIANIQKYKRGLEEKIKIKGRGGTDFQPCVDYCNEHHRKYACHIIFTDGEAPAPTTPNRLKTLWVHSSKSSINEALLGFKIKLN